MTDNKNILNLDFSETIVYMSAFIYTSALVNKLYNFEITNETLYVYAFILFLISMWDDSPTIESGNHKLFAIFVFGLLVSFLENSVYKYDDRHTIVGDMDNIHSINPKGHSHIIIQRPLWVLCMFGMVFTMFNSKNGFITNETFNKLKGDSGNELKEVIKSSYFTLILVSLVFIVLFYIINSTENTTTEPTSEPNTKTVGDLSVDLTMLYYIMIILQVGISIITLFDISSGNYSNTTVLLLFISIALSSFIYKSMDDSKEIMTVEPDEDVTTNKDIKFQENLDKAKNSLQEAIARKEALSEDANFEERIEADRVLVKANIDFEVAKNKTNEKYLSSDLDIQSHDTLLFISKLIYYSHIIITVYMVTDKL